MSFKYFFKMQLLSNLNYVFFVLLYKLKDIFSIKKYKKNLFKIFWNLSINKTKSGDLFQR